VVRPPETTLAIGDSAQLGAFVVNLSCPEPERGPAHNCHWESSNEGAATVEADSGLVTAVGRGSSTIRARCLEGVGTGFVTVP
jgi:uncharacterized protein YjdB